MARPMTPSARRRMLLQALATVPAGSSPPTAPTPPTRRSGAPPEPPTVAESGVLGLEMIAWTAVFVPAGTPEPVVAQAKIEVE